MQIRNKTEQGLWAMSLCALLLLAGCGKDQVLEFRNSEVINGKIYAEGANEPFSGKVTNISGLSTPLLNHVVDQLKTSAYQGLGTHLSPQLQRYFCDVDIKNGFFDGKAICRLPQDAAIMSEITYLNGSAEGPAKLYVPGKSDVLVAATFKSGTLDKQLEVFNPDNGKLVLNQGWRAGKIHGKIVQYTPDGSHLIYTSEVTDGLKDGIEESFDRETGKRNGLAEWRAGQPHGKRQQWDAAGNLVNDQVIENGILVSDTLQAKRAKEAGSTSSGTQACVDQRVKDHRREVGDDAMINAAQLEEWETMCSPAKALGGR